MEINRIVREHVAHTGHISQVFPFNFRAEMGFVEFAESNEIEPDERGVMTYTAARESFRLMMGVSILGINGILDNALVDGDNVGEPAVEGDAEGGSAGGDSEEDDAGNKDLLIAAGNVGILSREFDPTNARLVQGRVVQLTMPIRQILVDLSVCQASQPLSLSHFESYYQMMKMDTGSSMIRIADLQKIVRYLGCHITAYAGEVEMSRALTDNDWVKHRLSMSSAGSLLSSIVEKFPQNYTELISGEDRENIAAAANSPWDLLLARKISDSALAFGLIYSEVYETEIGTFYMGKKAKQRLPPQDVSRITNFLIAYKRTDKSAQRLLKAQTQDEAYLAFARKPSDDDRQIVSSQKLAVAQEWVRSHKRKVKLTEYKEILKAGGDLVDFDPKMLTGDELADVEDTFLGIDEEDEILANMADESAADDDSAADVGNN